MLTKEQIATTTAHLLCACDDPACVSKNILKELAAAYSRVVTLRQELEDDPCVRHMKGEP